MDLRKASLGESPGDTLSSRSFGLPGAVLPYACHVPVRFSSIVMMISRIAWIGCGGILERRSVRVNRAKSQKIRMMANHQYQLRTVLEGWRSENAGLLAFCG